MFFDTEDRRAWLLNGATALLHIVRASIETSRQGLFQSEGCFPPGDFTEGTLPHTSTSASLALLSKENRELVISRDKTNIRTEVTERNGVVERVRKWDERETTFQDLVEQKWHILEQMHDSQGCGPSGVPLKVPSRQYLRGFDFTDIASRIRDIQPKVTTLQGSGKLWIDFTTAIRTLTLFGRGFGEIFKPTADSNKLCPSWKEVPKDRDFLAVSVSDLRHVMETRGNHQTTPMRLVDDICWHRPDKLFDDCECTEDTSRNLFPLLKENCDRLQTLLSANSRRPKLVGPGCLESFNDGAVIFGSSSSSFLKWARQEEVKEERGSSRAPTGSESSFLNSSSSSRPGSSPSTPQLHISNHSNETDEHEFAMRLQQATE
jgi:hypothetical protein